jgi:hypothetical protein
MKTLITIGLLSVSTLALAGKAEREFMKSEVQPAIKAATESFKSACGCSLDFKVDEGTFKTTDQMTQIRNTANSIKDGAVEHCTDAESKKAMCALKTLSYKLDKESKFEFKGSTGTATTDGGSYVSWGMMTQEIDK